jgi:tritrans,polycis-undecaprenyl-diphosphate synthase [geranylgeranyl-diphosphate specific]
MPTPQSKFPERKARRALLIAPLIIEFWPIGCGGAPESTLTPFTLALIEKHLRAFFTALILTGFVEPTATRILSHPNVAKEFKSDIEFIGDTMAIEKVPGFNELAKLAAKFYQQRLLNDIKSGGVVPEHVAIILDGNRRFAREAGVPTSVGHALGADKLEEVLDWCRELGIKYVTVYAFSTENFNRSPEEVEALMDLFVKKLKKVASDERVHRNKVKVRVIGDRSRLPARVVSAIDELERATQNYDNFFVNIAMGYGGRAELVEAVRKICGKVEKGEIKPDEVSEEVIIEHLYTAGIPDPNLIIRTSGEERLSGFLIWQSAYSELYFCEAYWPAFSKIDFLRAVRTYQSRERRFGK